MNVACPAHQFLRSATAEDHARVDRAFGRFALDDARSYGEFLLAHARCVPPLEALLSPFSEVVPRTWMLLADLDVLGLECPAPLQIPDVRGEAAAWGASYVLEGSRLGGAVLRRHVPEHLPKAYLSATHGAGQWRHFLSALDRAVVSEDDRAEAVASARAVFALFATSAQLSGVHA